LNQIRMEHECVQHLSNCLKLCTTFRIKFPRRRLSAVLGTPVAVPTTLTPPPPAISAFPRSRKTFLFSTPLFFFSDCLCPETCVTAGPLPFTSSPVNFPPSPFPLLFLLRFRTRIGGRTLAYSPLAPPKANLPYSCYTASRPTPILHTVRNFHSLQVGHLLSSIFLLILVHGRSLFRVRH